MAGSGGSGAGMSCHGPPQCAKVLGEPLPAAAQGGDGLRGRSGALLPTRVLPRAPLWGRGFPG